MEVVVALGTRYKVETVWTQKLKVGMAQWRALAAEVKQQRHLTFFI